MTRLLVTLTVISMNVVVFGADSLPQVNVAPQNVEQLWTGYDPRSEPLEMQVVREWQEDDLTLRYVIYSIGTFKEKPARAAAFYGFPTDGKKLPAVMHMHGGGQRAFLQVVKRYAKRGYAALSVNWGGRPMEDSRAHDPNTDWGAVDPTQNNVGGYSNLLPQENTIDPFPSARNNNWFLLAIGCRRGITFLEQQPEVDADRIGVFGHSMGGRLTGLVAGSDERVRAASPSVGGSGFLQTDLWGLPGSARRVKGDVDLFQRTIAGQSYLKRLRCPILYLSATNDFNAPMDFVEKGMGLVPHENKRTTYAPHLNHRFTPETEIARPLWFDTQLQKRFQFPQSPAAELILIRDTGIPVFRVRPDTSLPIERVDVYYGYERDPRNRFWADGRATAREGVWEAECPVFDLDEPLFAFANVYYRLTERQRREGDPETFALSVSRAAYPDALYDAKVKATEQPRRLIDDFGRGFHDWYTLNANNRHHWLLSTRKLVDPRWEAPRDAKLSFEIKPTEARNTLAVQLKTDSWRGYSGRSPETWTALVQLAKAGRQRVELAANAFTNPSGKTLDDWYGVTELIFQPGAKSQHSSSNDLAMWSGEVPNFFELRWTGGEPVRRRKPFLASSRRAAGGLDDAEFQKAIKDSIRQEQIDDESSGPGQRAGRRLSSKKLVDRDANLSPHSRNGVALDPVYEISETSADVIVYGSTPGGVCAAIAAAREGASVILLEPTDHVGGMSTGGLSHCDSNQMVRSTLMGLFNEWHTRVVKDYTDRGLKAPYDPAKKDQSKWTFEPHVAMRVTLQMLDEAGVTVLTESYLKSVTKEGPRITSLVTKNGTFTARVFVDGSYEGDLMAAAGVDWTIGREGREEFGESLAGKQFPKKKMNISGFDENGKLLPLVTTDDARAEEAGDKKIMTYSFRLCLTTDPKNRVPMPKPDNYDPDRFEVIRRYLKSGGNTNAVGFDAYALPASQIVGIGTLPLPNQKFDGNNSIGRQFSIGLVGGANEWHSTDEAGRKKIWEAHKQYTLEFFHFLTTDPVVPAAIRNRYAKLGLCKDEFAIYDHFPPALYVRESRRMKGMYVISQKDIHEEPIKDDPIAISSFPIDSHDVQRVALKGGGVINEGTIFPVRNQKLRQGYAYHVPYRSILPRPEQCDNLLVPVALSCTHVGISSLRIEGAWMVIGQGAGVAAALAAKDNVPVQELEYAKLRERLLAQKQVLDLPEASDEPTATAPRSSINPKMLQGIVLDDADATLTGHWTRSTNFKPFVGRSYIHDERKGDGKSTATFRFKAPKSGRYQVLMAYSAHETRAKNVPVTVSSRTHRKNIAVDQTAPLPDGKAFRPIGTVDIEANVETIIQITNAETAGFVILDALQLLPIESELKTNE